ncbi:TetR/AcrR family transcriptional regulator [Stackebrandtia nassauensis]|uniref:Transcriptional regulator, TetR family n=1 Tax=Stackebrandtia nassauensis (strain DSM 44728 / CIP 108903 / NRRL B-16338 / NBRC 102104 / LLR-40K-21) TaxID=446470 RepID=D3PW75_STANL|nr:TetR/AcrR family transcriptional regulator [Stackebrandtia nassauensis]ADD41232.1 transcriptional regulator, TetR family [Stackebrandtia nassauensis DSM 44728]
MTSHTRRPGTGPRQAERLYRVVLELLREHGFDELAIETVAQRAGVNKTTIYRWWPSKDALVADALIHSELLDLDVPDTGSLRGDLTALVRQVRLLLSGADTAPIATSVFAAAASRPELAGLTRDFFADRLSRERVVFERAIARGDIHPDTDVTLAVDLALGAVWTRVVLRQQDVGEAFDAEVTDLLLAGLTPRT